VLDISSPQWFSLLLASRHPDISVQYVNIIDRELDPYREIARALGLANLKYDRADARELSCPARSFDRVISISVIEHIYPAEDGDLRALREIARVLKPGGEFLLTVPCKAQGRIVYVDGAVYEREGQERKFFAREYDRASFASLVKRGGFKTESTWLLGERPGLLAIDHYEWGPARGTLLARLNIAGRKVISRLFHIVLDEPVARRYLTVSREGDGRLVNIAARLHRA
jgi:SAM-dependent methyltransferase